ncbi:hypothetical protein Tsubulata_010640 [Turnera subulata]|uniref:KIB1-4 beta-propeller domain-containing protein n=1 Tax=Turnera subulata TaxID=218843 RepID=A0A9Q0FKD9_9ROSI|nr:hypothetical protein Tsubulata_010640 [Turnera subulata]
MELKSANSSSLPLIDGERVLDVRDLRVKEMWFEYSLVPVDACSCAVRAGRVAVSSSLSKNTGNGLTVMAVTPRRKLAMWRKGDDGWKLSRNNSFGADRVVFTNGHFYASNLEGKVVKIGSTNPSFLNIRRVAQPKQKFRWSDVYLVETLGDLFLVYKEGTTDNVRFKVEKLDWKEGKWVKPSADELKGCLLFPGYNSSFSLVANDFPEYKINCIYLRDVFSLRVSCCHRCGFLGCIRIFDVEDGLLRTWCDYYGSSPIPSWLQRLKRYNW